MQRLKAVADPRKSFQTLNKTNVSVAIEEFSDIKRGTLHVNVDTESRYSKYLLINLFFIS